VPVEPSKGNEVKVAGVHVEDLREENRGGTDVVVLETGDGSEYSNFKNKLEAKLENRDKYIGSDWLIQYTVVERNGNEYKDLIGFEEELDGIHAEASGDSESDDRDQRIQRQSAAHDASRVVEGMLAGDYFKKTGKDREELREKIQGGIEYWTERFKQHHRTGDWSRGESDDE
jgi:hypothetical protein